MERRLKLVCMGLGVTIVILATAAVTGHAEDFASIAGGADYSGVGGAPQESAGPVNFQSAGQAMESADENSIPETSDGVSSKDVSRSVNLVVLDPSQAADVLKIFPGDVAIAGQEETLRIMQSPAVQNAVRDFIGNSIGTVHTEVIFLATEAGAAQGADPQCKVQETANFAVEHARLGAQAAIDGNFSKASSEMESVISKVNNEAVKTPSIMSDQKVKDSLNAAHMVLANVARLNGDPSGALSHINTAIEYGANDAWTYRVKGDAAYEVGDFVNSINSFTNAANLTSDTKGLSSLTYNLCLALKGAGRTDEAITLAENSSTKFNESRFLSLKGGFLQESGKTEEALALFDNQISSGQATWETYYFKGVTLYESMGGKEGDAAVLNQTISCYDKAIELSEPDEQIIIYGEKGIAMQKLGLASSKTDPVFNKVLELIDNKSASGAVSSNYYKGVALQGLGRNDEAHQIYNQVKATANQDQSLVGNVNNREEDFPFGSRA